MNLKSQVRDLVKLLGVAFLVCVGLACCLVVILLLVLHPSSPPKEKKVIRNFYAHRATYERLRDMLIEDKQSVRVASWGIETTKSIATAKPPAGDFPLNRYNEYLSLLKETSAIGAHRDTNEPLADVCIWIYASGWAGDTRHMDICWENQVPTNQVAGLDDFYKTPKPRKPVFRHVESDWYLWADW